MQQGKILDVLHRCALHFYVKGDDDITRSPSGYGIVGDIIVGLLGAFIGNRLLLAMNFSLNFGAPVLNRVVVSLVGALVLMFVVGMLCPRSQRERASGVWRR